MYSGTHLEGMLWVILTSFGGYLAKSDRHIEPLFTPFNGKSCFRIGPSASSSILRRGQGSLHKGKSFWGMVQVVFPQPAEMETLGGPHAVEQKQTNGLSGASSVA